jgi:hypothetical protein
MHAELFGEIGLHDVEAKTLPLDVVADGLRGRRNGLGAFQQWGWGQRKALICRWKKGNAWHGIGGQR